VLLGTDGRAVLTDFGIATLEGDTGLTQAGMVMGTPGFTAPERVRGLLRVQRAVLGHHLLQ
jgi:eukaryotic-like serine/threonine-protein kinase